jgi:hypothetical protein
MKTMEKTAGDVATVDLFDQVKRDVRSRNGLKELCCVCPEPLMGDPYSRFWG